MFATFYTFKKRRIDITLPHIPIKAPINTSKPANWNTNGLYGKSSKIVPPSFSLNIPCSELYVTRIKPIGIIDPNTPRNNPSNKNGNE